MTKEFRIYRIIYFFVSITIGLFYWVKPVGRKNIPDGAAVVCANHSSWVDPLLVALAFSKKVHLHMMAKAELFKNKIFNFLFSRAGIFPVRRGEADVKAVRMTLKCLKDGEKVLIFPEGTRVVEGMDSEAKTGAVKMATRASAPIVPVYVPRVKKPFRRLPIVIGEPYTVNSENAKLNTSDYIQIADDLMDRIEELKQ